MNQSFSFGDYGSYEPGTRDLTATGTTQADALPLLRKINHIGPSPAGSGVILPQVQSSLTTEITLINRAPVVLNVYPPNGGQIEQLAPNAAYVVAANTCTVFTCFDSVMQPGNLWLVVALNVTPDGGLANGVSSFNGRTGDVTLLPSDITAAGGALAGSPSFTGDPQAPTPPPGDNDNSIATTQFVMNALTNVKANVIVAAAPPPAPVQGELWWDDTIGQLFVSYTDANSTQWVTANSAEGISEAPNDASVYGRHALGWTAVATTAQLTGYLPLTGGTLSGNLSINVASGWSVLGMSSPSGQAQVINGQTNGVSRWQLYLGDSAAETGGNAGSNFAINRMADNGSYIDTPISITRSTGLVGINDTLQASTGRVVSVRSGNNPAVAVWDSAQGYAAGMFIGSGNNLYFGNMDGGGNYVGPWYGRFDTSGNFWASAALTGTYVHSTGDAVADGTVYSGNCAFALSNNYGYRLQRNSSNGEWDFFENGQWNFAVRTNGDVQARSAVYCNYLQSYGSAYTAGNDSADTFTARGWGVIYSNWGNTNRVAWNWNAGSNLQCYIDGSYVGFLFSDGRVKNVVGDYDRGLAELKQLQPVRYQLKGNDRGIGKDAAEQKLLDETPTPHNTEIERVGVIAQDAETVLPEMFTRGSAMIDGQRADDVRLRDSGEWLLWAAVNAIKELDTRLAKLEARTHA